MRIFVLNILICPIEGEHHLDAGAGGLIAPPADQSSHPQTSPKINPTPLPVTGHLPHPRTPLTQPPPRGCVQVKINVWPCFLSYRGGLCREGACYCVKCTVAETSPSLH
ncbi:hypothetical protein VPH35_140669 [Triticum aestivum]